MMTYLGIGASIIGIIMLCAGWYSGVKGKTIGKGLILIVSGVLIGIGGNPARDMPNGSPAMVALGFCGIGAVIIMIILNRLKNSTANKEQAQKRAESIGATMLDRFFVECVLSGADDFSLEKNKQRAHFLRTNTSLRIPMGLRNYTGKVLKGTKLSPRELHQII